MEIRELIQSPQLFVVYAITILYTITFSLAAVVTQPTDAAVSGSQSMHQAAKAEIQPDAVRNSRSG
ncbi:hypothetical protein [Nitrosomonas ureae]|uniref:Uncharacterized protein n=1 Tax=Nitrosomonas ureae TaxID=44577 RepID=A0A1H5TXD5_9PROT|nr:hypothetical protein [Nitrosomonas ureae]SEF67390.1 hypothetical protein SAMN05216334_1068 [Nitrosomonas ureae]